MQVNIAREIGQVISLAEARVMKSGLGPLFFPTLIVISSIALLIRIEDIGYVTESLWGEDGSVFINQSHQLGLRSLWQPLNGYLWMYHRVVALLTRSLPLVAIPYLFFFAWFVAFFSVVAVLEGRVKSVGLSEPLTAFLVCAIALQPNHGESLFNLNNTHTILGMALAFHVCIPRRDPRSALSIIFVIFASLTGPFSTFMIPVLVMQMVILRDFSARRATYISVAVCGLIQAFVILTSERAGLYPIDLRAEHWLRAIISLLTFGGSNRLGNIAACMLWILTSVFVFKWVLDRTRTSDRILSLSPLFSMVTAIILFFIAAVAAGEGMVRLSPLDVGSRYFLIPYALLFFAALVCTKEHRAAQTIQIALISMICAAAFLTVDRGNRASTIGLLSHENLQWVAFTKFREVQPDVVIPVNPSWPVYPPVWNVTLKKGDSGDGSSTNVRAPILLAPLHSASPAGEVGPKGMSGGNSTEPGRTLYFDISGYCARGKHQALEVEIWRSRMGWATLHWGRQGSFDSKRSLKRFYPAGVSVMQFAFHRDLSDHLLRLDPTNGVADSAIVRQLSVWKSDLARVGIILGEPTKPGGDMRIKEVRLFCLQ